MESKPRVVVLSTHEKDGREIVKGILDLECLPNPEVENEGVECWAWEMENKYYTASVLLTTVPHPEKCLQWILESGEALIIYCDATQNDALDSINSLVENVGEFEPEVQMLVCDSCSSEDGNGGLSRLNAQQWCISNGWELIELNRGQETNNEDSEDEDDFPESLGFKRVRQALHAHTWSNLVMKDNNRSSRLNAVLQSVASKDDKNGKEGQESDEVLYSQLSDLTVEDNNTGASPLAGEYLDPMMMEGCLEKDEGDFENLFSSFEHLKRTASSLPPDQRRDYAEKVAVAFWRAMGGDEDEVDGLDSE
ncbi:alpha- and gamma-adaptin-binding protein p34-like [Penaeus chinensis]|uniref:alpha- and gamma-adaptin-binding protein p34-like n=1 Tax=Penaeus chinensis TaxID=139456 RepID=UPI001FB7F50D|nr:alpha- and gamma-adaptin-binding protein p34-like [Penaeus chinensis]